MQLLPTLELTTALEFFSHLLCALMPPQPIALKLPWIMWMDYVDYVDPVGSSQGSSTAPQLSSVGRKVSCFGWQAHFSHGTATHMSAQS